MNIDKIIKSLTLKEKIAQMFIMGFSGNELIQDNINIKKAVEMGLGGIIYFADNIKSTQQTSKLSENLQNIAKIPLFISIDQEGGLVERTINSIDKIDYLTPMALSSSKNPENIKIHTEIMAKELKELNINMNFAPVLDVNTNPSNPIIGIRAFGNDPDQVIKHSQNVYKIFKENNIIAVGKHFPGHGEAFVDSHSDMPIIDLNLDQLEKIHIKPFKKAIENNLDAIMIAHVKYLAFNKENIPASLSYEIITDYLKNHLGFSGLIISDDMVMGGITKNYDEVNACIKAINAGIDILIFRNSTDQNLELLDKLVLSVENKSINEERIDESVRKILLFKEKYKIIKDKEKEQLNIKEAQSKINQIALETIEIEKKGNLIPLNKDNNVLIISPNKSEIHHYANDNKKLSDFLSNINCTEIVYSLNPSTEEIKQIQNHIKCNDIVIFISYNAVLNQGQFELFNCIAKPIIAIAAGIPYDTEKFDKADSIIKSFCYKTPSLKAISKILLG